MEITDTLWNNLLQEFQTSPEDTDDQRAHQSALQNADSGSWQFAVCSLRSEKAENESSFARSGYGVTGIKYQEKESG